MDNKFQVLLTLSLPAAAVQLRKSLVLLITSVLPCLVFSTTQQPTYVAYVFNHIKNLSQQLHLDLVFTASQLD